MDIKVGQKVKFLNEEGGGVVREIVDQNTVLVSIPEGFDIPVPTNELISLETATPEEKGFRPQHDEKIEDAEGYENVGHSGAEHEVQGSTEALKERARSWEQSITISQTPAFYLAFETKMKKNPMAGNLDVYLVNNTGHDVCYVLYLHQEEKMNRVSHGVMGQGKRHFLENIARQEVSRWCKGWIQLIVADKQFPPPEPENTAFKIRPSRFFSEENFKVYPGQSNPTLLYCLSRSDLLLKADQAKTCRQETHTEKASESHPPLASRKALIDKFMISDEEARVDLHIEQISDEHHRMNAMEKLNRQVSFFQRILQSAITNKVKRLVIIHGVGEGILKAEVRRELKQYDYIDVEDAPIAHYGVGATIAIIYA